MAHSESIVRSSKSESRLRTAVRRRRRKMHSPAPSRATEATRQILPDETPGEIRGILATLAADGTARRFMVAEREGFKFFVRRQRSLDPCCDRHAGKDH